jgi:tetratricopeptide (TPR) repeat protein
MNALLFYWLVVLTLRTPYASDYLQRDIFKPSNVRHQIALFTALLFVSHPVQTQAVTYIVQRFASLATLFYLVSLVMYIKARCFESSRRARYAFYAASILSTVLAMRTKEISFTLPVMIILYEWMFFKGETKRRLLYLLPFLLTMSIIPLTLMGFKGSSAGFSGVDEISRMAGLKSVPRWDYLNTEFRVIVTYIRLLFFPVHQNLDYDYPIYRSFFNPEVMISFLFLLALFGLGVYMFYASSRTKKGNRFWLRWVSFGIVWFFVTLSVESSIIPIRDVIFEHRLYLPSVGFFMALMSGIAFIKEALANRTGGIEKAFMPVMIFLVMGLSATAYARNTVWQDGVTLWEDVIKKSPNKARPYLNLGGIYLKQGRMNETIAAYQAAIKRKPDYAEAHNNLGVAYQKKGRLDDAVQEIQTALKYKPDYAEAHNTLGQVYYDQGRFDDAFKEYQTALKYKPNYAEAHNNLGVLYQRQGRLDDAIKEIQMALMDKPEDAEGYYNLGTVYIKMGKLDEAKALLLKAVGLDPSHVSAHNNLGIIYALQKQYEEAYREFQAVLKIDHNNKDARYNIEILHRDMKNRQQPN